MPDTRPVPPVIFRCNASAEVGLGHLMRCRELARMLKADGHATAILGPPDSLRTDADAALFDRWEAVETRGDSATDAARVLDLAARMGARHAVMDDYRIDPDYQLRLRAAGLRWLQQFDASRPWDFHADVLVNCGPHERAEHYDSHIRNPDCLRLMGPRYAVLRPAFHEVVRSADGRPVRRIFAAFGGGDDRGAFALTLEALAGHLPRGVTLEIVSGPGNPNNDSLAARVDPLDGVTFSVNPPDLPARMTAADLAVIACGTMSYEAAFCGLPMVVLPLAPNQVRACRGWADLAGAAIAGRPDDTTPQILRAIVRDLIEDDATRRDMATRGRAAVDGNGGRRLLDALLGSDMGAAP